MNTASRRAWTFDFLPSRFMIPINTRLFWWEPELTSRGRGERCGINNCCNPKDTRATAGGYMWHVKSPTLAHPKGKTMPYGRKEGTKRALY